MLCENFFNKLSVKQKVILMKMMDSLTDQLCLQDLVAATGVTSQHHHHHQHNVQIPDTTTHMQSGAVQGHTNSPVSALTAPSFTSPHHHVTTLLPPPTMTSHHHHLHHLNHAMSAGGMTRTGILGATGSEQQPCSTTMHNNDNNKHKRGNSFCNTSAIVQVFQVLIHSQFTIRFTL